MAEVGGGTIAPTRIGCGAGFAGDRLEPAVDLLKRGELDFLVLECLAERTIAADALRRLQDPEAGYDPMLDRRLGPLLPLLRRNGTRLVSNIGAANPLAAGRRVQELSSELGLDLRVAVVLGDDVLDKVDPGELCWEDGEPLVAHGRLVSANAYLGADAIVEALGTGADVVIAGRVADPSLFLAPLAYARGWDLGDTRLAAHGTVVGHLLECAGQVTGGYFADPPWDTVPALENLGFPLAEVSDDDAVVTKLPATGGRLDVDTVLAQLSYEIMDPAAYLTPDVTADFTGVEVEQLGRDRVRVRGARGRERPADLKVTVGYWAGFQCEAEMSYAGHGARARAQLAAEVVSARLAGLLDPLTVEIVGVDPIAGPDGADLPGSGECRLRVAAIAESRSVAERLGEEMMALYTNGPAGGGGARRLVSEVIGVVSTSIGRERAEPWVEEIEVATLEEAL